MTDSSKKDLDTALDGVDANRRQFLRKVVLTTAFAAPVVASFAVDGMMISSASAASCGNLSNCS
ncbi:MAG TPA: hypothetical protein VGV07_24810 [Devosia sp.]|jgi:hypothetical protein|uniref:hypothetical protein n=1 Tax=Devosia sp. TaxID=1871048 RepID=UPI002DDD9190|nr:hypothetical protein [Devosia sp.]HEV2518492.1 hypothetical protein [Devosia sp.]